MALDLSLLGRTSVQAVVALVNYTLATTIDPNWVTIATPSRHPFTPPIALTLQAITVPDGQGNAPPYYGSHRVSFNRVGFQVAFTGLTIQLRLQPPFTFAQIAAALYSQYGIVIEQGDIQDTFTTEAVMDEFNNISLKPSGGSTRFYVDFSPFEIVININTALQDDLSRLIAMTQTADIAALDAANRPPARPYPPGTPPLDQP
jgi:hypothetical protein